MLEAQCSLFGSNEWFSYYLERCVAMVQQTTDDWRKRGSGQQSRDTDDYFPWWPAVQNGSQEPHVLFRLNLKPSFSITLAVFQVLSSHMWCKAMGFANTMVLFILAAPLHRGPWARTALAGVCSGENLNLLFFVVTSWMTVIFLPSFSSYLDCCCLISPK